MLGSHRFIWNPAVGKNDCWLKLFPHGSPATDVVRLEGQEARLAHNDIMSEPEGPERTAVVRDLYEKFSADSVQPSA